MAEPTFPTPQEAAVADFPPEYVRVENVSYSSSGNRATVTLLTNEEPNLYPYYVQRTRFKRSLDRDGQPQLSIRLG
jgi:hypothetical protein